MYLDYYRLKHAPFDITPNPRFLFHSTKHREAFNHMLYGIRERKGFVQLTGEVGAGKTTLCRALLDQLDSHFSTALILNPVLDADELMQAIATEFGLNVRGESRRETVAAISEFLLRQIEFGKETVLIIDEAQNLTPKQMKTLVTRAGPGTKVVCMGNIAQIDTPYLTEGSSGLTYVVDRFKGWVHGGHVTLLRGERSRLADYAGEVL